AAKASERAAMIESNSNPAVVPCWGAAAIEHSPSGSTGHAGLSPSQQASAASQQAGAAHEAIGLDTIRSASASVRRNMRFEPSTALGSRSQGSVEHLRLARWTAEASAAGPD